MINPSHDQESLGNAVNIGELLPGRDIAMLDQISIYIYTTTSAGYVHGKGAILGSCHDPKTEISTTTATATRCTSLFRPTLQVPYHMGRAVREARRLSLKGTRHSHRNPYSDNSKLMCGFSAISLRPPNLNVISTFRNASSIKEDQGTTSEKLLYH